MGWDFNYLDQRRLRDRPQAELTGKPAPRTSCPTLYLPVGKRIEFVLTSRDVIHSFWVPAFLRSWT